MSKKSTTSRQKFIHATYIKKEISLLWLLWCVPTRWLSNFKAPSFFSAPFYKDSLSDRSHRPSCHSEWNNWKRTMKLYLHRNRVTCQRLQCRTLISFVFNQNETFCWCRLFFFSLRTNDERVCGSVSVSMLHYLLLSCFSFSVLVSASGWLHLKLGDRLQIWETRQMAQWWYFYLAGINFRFVF